MTYRNGKPFAAYIGLGRGLGERSVRSEELGPEIVVDFGEDGRPLGIEVIDPVSATAEDISPGPFPSTASRQVTSAPWSTGASHLDAVMRLSAQERMRLVQEIWRHV